MFGESRSSAAMLVTVVLLSPIMNVDVHMEPKINISLEKHLLDSLKEVCHILPEYLRHALNESISDPHATVIPYDVLSKISAWSRSEDGRRTLKENTLDPHSYSIVALLAGTITSPERKFGTYVPPTDPQVVEAERARERKAITALANGVLSVVGVGVGAYWASDKTGWRNEWVCQPNVLCKIFCLQGAE